MPHTYVCRTMVFFIRGLWLLSLVNLLYPLLSLSGNHHSVGECGVNCSEC